MTENDKALVERLRDFVIAEDIDLAADRIEALSAENERLHGIIKTAWFFASRLTLIAVGLTIIWSVLP